MIQSKPRAVLRTGGYKKYGLSNRRRIGWVAGALAILLLLGVGVAWAFHHFGRDPRLAEIDSLREQARDGGRNRELWQQVREKENQLPDNLRRQLDQGDNQWQARDAERMKAFFAKTHDEQMAEINKWIDRMQAREKEREAKAAADAASKGSGGDGSSQANGNASSKGGPGRRGGGTDQDRLAAKKRGIDRMPPELRAQHTLMREMRQQALASRGLPQGWADRGGFGGGR